MSEAPPAHAAKRLTLSEAFEIGYCWQQMLDGQTLEDSRAVGRTLLCDLFEKLPLYVHAVPSFESSDIGICAAKAEIHRVLDMLDQSPAPAVPEWREIDSAPSMEWQKIETAPQDGRVIWLRFGQDRTSVGKYVADRPRPWLFFDTDDQKTFVNYAVDGPGGPSHWAELHPPSSSPPPPPEPDFEAMVEALSSAQLREIGLEASRRIPNGGIAGDFKRGAHGTTEIVGQILRVGLAILQAARPSAPEEVRS